MASAKHKVQLYVYDLSQGMAKLLSAQFLGKQIDGIWHTGIVAYGHEYYYGGGIQAARPGMTLAGRPTQVIDLGETEVSQDVFQEWLHSVSPRFTPETYSLLSHNCNNFTSECAKFLLNKDIPAFITGLPEEALSTPLGQMLKPVIMQMESQMKQNVGGLVPWQESGPSPLNLPRVDPSRSATAAPSSPIPAAVAASASVSNTSAASQSHPVSSSTSEEKKAAELGHYHTALKLSAVRASNKPLLSVDQKAKSFETLIKTQSKKFGAENGLSDSERALLATVVSKMETPTEANAAPVATLLTAQEVADLCALFDRLVRTWPASAQFPVLGLLRLLVLREDIRAHYFKAYQTKDADLVDVLARYVRPKDAKAESPLSTHLMALCTLSNLFVAPEFGKLLALHEPVYQAAAHSMEHKEQSVRSLGAALLYNISLFLPNDDSDAVVQCVNTVAGFSQSEQDEETCYRLLCGLGQLVYCNDSAVALLCSLEFKAQAVAARFPNSGRIKAICGDIATIVATLEM